MIARTALPRLPREPRVELKPATLERKKAWAWCVRSNDGRAIGWGIKRTGARAIERALELFPDALPPEVA